jgi:hypothetical protein
MIKRFLFISVLLTLLLTLPAACGSNKTETVPPDEVIRPVAEAVLLNIPSEAAERFMGETPEDARSKLIETMVEFYAEAQNVGRAHAELMAEAYFSAIDGVISFTIGDPIYSEDGKTAFVDVFVLSISQSHFETVSLAELAKIRPDDFDSLSPQQQGELGYRAFIETCGIITAADEPRRVRVKLDNINDKWIVDNSIGFIGNLYSAYAGMLGAR